MIKCARISSTNYTCLNLKASSTFPPHTHTHTHTHHFLFYFSFFVCFIEKTFNWRLVSNFTRLIHDDHRREHEGSQVARAIAERLLPDSQTASTHVFACTHTHTHTHTHNEREMERDRERETERDRKR